MMSRPFIISIGVHVVFTLLVVFGMPMLGRDLPEEMPLVRLEVVRTVPETNLIEGDKPSTAKEEQQATVTRKPPPPPPPPPPPKPAAAAPAAPPPEPTSEPEAPAEDPAAEILPDKPLPKPKLAKLDIPKPKPKPKAKVAPKSKPKPVMKPVSKPKRPGRPAPPAPKPVPKPVDTAKPVPPQKSKANDALASQLNKMVKDTKKRADAATGVLQNLAEAKVAAKDAEQARKTQERKVAADTVTKTLSAVAGNAVKAPPKKSIAPVGIDDVARIQQHVSKGWQPPLGAAGNDTLIVDIFVSVNRDGEVLKADIEDKLRFNLDSYFKASAIAAQRAIVDCSPLPIPPQKYDQLKEFTFEFNPKFISR
ncbi:MAG: TonB C-terminal domain-containing protein [Rhodobiaceae bacterium]